MAEPTRIGDIVDKVLKDIKGRVEDEFEKDQRVCDEQGLL